MGNVPSTISTFISVAGTSHPIQNFTRFFSSAGEAVLNPQAAQSTREEEENRVSQTPAAASLVPTFLYEHFQKAGHALYVHGAKFIAAQVFVLIFIKNDSDG